MITFVRTAIAMPGKQIELFAYAKEIVAVSKAVTGKELTTASHVGGNANQICWTVQYESLADMETNMGRLFADSRYLELLKKGAGLIVPGSVQDQIWRTF